MSSSLSLVDHGASPSSALQRLLAQKNQELEDRNKLLLQARAAIEKMQIEIEAVRSAEDLQRRQTRRAYEDSQSSLTSLQEALRHQEEKERGHLNEISSLRTQVAELQAQLAVQNTVREEVKDLRNRSLLLEEQLREKDVELSEARRKITDQALELQIKSSAAGQLNVKLEERDRVLRQRESDLRSAESRERQMESEMAMMQEEIARLRDQMKLRESELISRFEREKREIEGHMRAEGDARTNMIQSRIQELAVKEASLSAQLSELHTSSDTRVAAERAKSAELERRLQTETRRFKQLLQAKQEELEKMQRIHDQDVIKARELMASELQAQRAQMQSLMSKKDAGEKLQSDANALLSSISAQVNELKKELFSAMDNDVVEGHVNVWHRMILERLKTLIDSVDQKILRSTSTPWQRFGLQQEPSVDPLSHRALWPTSKSVGSVKVPDDVHELRKIVTSSCRQLGVDDAQSLPAVITRTAKLVTSIPPLEKFIDDVMSIVKRHRSLEGSIIKDDDQPLIRHPEAGTPEDALIEIQSWSESLRKSGEIRLLKKQVVKALRKRSVGSEDLSTRRATNERIINSIRELVLNERSFIAIQHHFHDAETLMKVKPDVITHKIVSVFQSLFSVKGLHHVLPRMHDVYVEHNDYQLAFKLIRSMLKLNSDASVSEVLNGIRRVVCAQMGTAV
eukprot:tig00021590_g22761.t1